MGDMGVGSVPETRPRASGDDTPRRGGIARAAVSKDWSTFDNVFNSSHGSAQFMVCDPLIAIRQDASGAWRPVPVLLERWELTPDRMMLHLRRGVTFHDGTPWNAAALRWNIEHMLNAPGSLARGALSGLDTSDPITVLDGRTARLNLTRPSPSLPDHLASHYTLPISPTAYTRLGPERFARQPIGAGPFRFVEWTPDGRVILARNDDYWMKGADGRPLPYLDGVEYRIVIDDATRFQKVRDGSLDVADVGALAAASDDDEATLSIITGTWFASTWRLAFSATHGAFSRNYALRQAALYALDREALARAMAGDDGIASRFLLIPASPAYDPSLPHYWYDPERARRLMIEAGFPDGLDVTVSVIERPADIAQAELLREMWARIGLRVTADVLERGRWVERVFGAGDYDVAAMINGGSAADPDLYLRMHLWAGGAFNVAHVNDPAIAGALDRASAAGDWAARLAAYREVQRRDYELAYYGYLWMRHPRWAVHHQLRSFPPPTGAFWDFRAAWIEG